MIERRFSMTFAAILLCTGLSLAGSPPRKALPHPPPRLPVAVPWSDPRKPSG
jgi:hypothetical protein